MEALSTLATLGMAPSPPTVARRVTQLAAAGAPARAAALLHEREQLQVVQALAARSFSDVQASFPPRSFTQSRVPSKRVMLHILIYTLAAAFQAGHITRHF